MNRRTPAKSPCRGAGRPDLALIVAITVNCLEVEPQLGNYQNAIDYQGAHLMDVMDVVVAKLKIERYLQDASPEVKGAWRVILAELDPSLKVKRRKVG